MASVVRRNLSHAIADELLAAIREGKYRPGERLPTEQGLMRLYGVGRNSVREAVHSLVAMGVLDVRPGRGAIVLSLGAESALDPPTVSALLRAHAVSDLYDFRELLEVEAAGRAASAAGPGELLPITQALDRYAWAVRAGTSPYLADLEFHRAVAAASGNVVFPQILDAVADVLAFARAQTDRVPGAVERALVEHAAVRDAIAAHDPAAARRAMAAHIASAKEAVERVRAMGGESPEDAGDRGAESRLTTASGLP